MISSVLLRVRSTVAPTTTEQRLSWVRCRRACSREEPNGESVGRAYELGYARGLTPEKLRTINGLYLVDM